MKHKPTFIQRVTHTPSKHRKYGRVDCGEGPVAPSMGQVMGRVKQVTVAPVKSSAMEDQQQPRLLLSQSLTHQTCILYYMICPMRGCSDDLNKRCPEELMLKGGGGCHSPCQVFGTPNDCCKNSLTTCASYSRLFTAVCPRSDNDDGPLSCDSTNYTVRFCPPPFSKMKVGSQLNHNDQLVSISGKFKLGFGQRANYEYYLGIWYTGDNAAQRVWVANPSAPVVPESSILTIDPNTGNLIIIFGYKFKLKISNLQAGPNPNVTATLEDNGNFRLINETDGRVLWQSFDHPTKTELDADFLAQ